MSVDWNFVRGIDLGIASSNPYLMTGSTSGGVQQAQAQVAARQQAPTPPAVEEAPYNYDTDPETLRLRERLQAERDMAASAEANRVQNATEAMRGLLESYGLNALYTRVVDFIKQGYDADSIMVMIRTTPEYKQRFPAMEALARKGRAISEGEYIAYEQTAAGLERRYGLPQGMLMGNVTGLLEAEVSAAELNDRVLLAASASLEVPQDVRDTFTQYYNIGQGGLTAYFLDPGVATPLLEKQYASARIGTEAMRQGVGIDVGIAQNLQELGVSPEQAREGFGAVGRSRGLTEGRGDVVNQQQLISGLVAGDQRAQQDIERAVGGRLGRFQGGGEFLTTGQGAVGLGTAAQ